MEPDSTYVHNTPTMASIGDEMLRKNYASTHSPHSWQVPQQKVSDRSNTPSDGYMQVSDEEHSKSHTHQTGTSHDKVQNGMIHKRTDPSQRLTSELRSNLHSNERNTKASVRICYGRAHVFDSRLTERLID